MERRADPYSLLQDLWKIPYAHQILKLRNLAHGNGIRQHRHVDPFTQIQKLKVLINAIPYIQNDHLVRTFCTDHLQKPFPVFPRCTSDICRCLYRRNIIQVIDALNHAVHLMDEILIILLYIIEKITQIMGKSSPHQFLKPGIFFQIQIKHCSFFRKYLP